MKVLIRHCLPHSSFDLFGWRQVKKPISKPSLITNISQTKDSCVNSIPSCVTNESGNERCANILFAFWCVSYLQCAASTFENSIFFSVVLFVKILSPLFLLLFLLFCLLKILSPLFLLLLSLYFYCLFILTFGHLCAECISFAPSAQKQKQHICVTFLWLSEAIG